MSAGRSTIQRVVAAMLGVALVVVSSGVAGAEPTVDPVRYWPVPADFQPGDIGVDAGVDGVGLLWKRPAADAGEAPRSGAGCRLARAGERRALVHTYRHDFLPTRCVDATALPDGGLVVRAEFGEAGGEFDRGVTARIDDEGELVWTREDQEWIDRAARPDGPGAFRGEYAGPVQGLAYDASGGEIAVLAVGEEALTDERRHRIVQAQILDAETGDVEYVGRSFGEMGGEEIVDVAARDGAFLMVTTDADDGAPAFYSFESRGSVEYFEPGGADWSARRIVGPVDYRSERGTFVLWSGDDENDAATGALRLEGRDDVVWAEQFDDGERPGGAEGPAPEPVRMWAGDRRAAVLYRGAGDPERLQVLDVEDGTTVGTIEWREAIEYTPVGMVRGPEGRLRILALDRSRDLAWEYALSTGGSDDESPVDIDDGRDDGDTGGCTQTAGRGPGPAIALVVLLWAADRRRRSTVA